MHSLKDNRCAAIQHLYLMTGLSTLFATGSTPFRQDSLSTQNNKIGIDSDGNISSCFQCTKDIKLRKPCLSQIKLGIPINPHREGYRSQGKLTSCFALMPQQSLAVRLDVACRRTDDRITIRHPPTRHLKHPAAPQTFLGFARAVASATNGSSGQ